ncbi:TPA: hypothetical protein NHR53_006675 [Pseudomonas aeruginosa]|nr:hypothetical protein [Pseudomonas aeruginosa]HCE8130059.1 hypothetical protein [Pseudomonas aeruginosa]HCF0448351.1 hypothetical protein [Pseudomonas aeruginosa]
MEKIDLRKGEPISLNLLEAGRDFPDHLVELLEQIGETALDGDQKHALRAVIADLPHHATMRDLIEVLKAKEAEELGITLEQYEALAPLFLALQAPQEEGAYFQLFVQGANE